ncbi:hypothetical protein ACFQO7_27920 [Catellatospora aurea]|uniref:Uncharacterized protein n=1 Tax=Catellatospora aurea TaxID=1337874 RepID=A0ABW2H5P7_9ACTN
MIDLKELLDERSTPPTDLAQHLRMHEVRGRIAVRRRRRITAAGVFAAVVALIVTGYGTLPALRGAPDPAVTPSPAPRLIEGFPEYASGTRVVAAGTSEPGTTSLTVTWTPTTLDFRVFYRCTVSDENTALEMTIALNGRPTSGGSCRDGGSSFSWPRAEKMSADYGLRVGSPSSLTMTATNSVRWPADGKEHDNGPVPADATMSLAVGDDVPFADYPLPPRPTVLRTLDPRQAFYNGEVEAAFEDRLLVHSDPADPLRPMSVTVIWRDHYDLLMEAQTPGTLAISLNGVEVDSPTWWDYNVSTINRSWETSSYEPYYDDVPGFIRPTQGSVVTVTIMPRNITGAWFVQITPGVKRKTR